MMTNETTTPSVNGNGNVNSNSNDILRHLPQNYMNLSENRVALRRLADAVNNGEFSTFATVANAARLLRETSSHIATKGTLNEVAVLVEFARTVFDAYDLRDTPQGTPLQGYLSYMAEHGLPEQLRALRERLHTQDNPWPMLRDMAHGIGRGAPILSDKLEQGHTMLPGMEQASFDMPAVVCPHCGMFTPLHTALLNENALIHGAYHCPHCSKLAWWRAFNPVTGLTDGKVEVCTAILTDIPTPMSRRDVCVALRDGRIDADCTPFMFVDTDSHGADASHPWHMRLFSLDSIETEQLDRLDEAYFATCARCATPVPCRDVLPDGRLDDEDEYVPDGWSAQITSRQDDLREIEFNDGYGRTWDVIICEDDVDAMNLLACDHCGVYVEEGDSVRVHGARFDTYMCEQCANDHAYRCEGCGDWYEESLVYSTPTGDWYCGDCYDPDAYYDDEDDSHHRIHEYSYKPSPKKHGDGIWDAASQKGGSPMFHGYGVEIEHSSEGQKRAMAEAFCDSICDDETYFYMKEDGSVETGIEFVSHPVTLAAWQNPFGKAQACLRAICDIASEYSYDREDDGFHIHVSRTAFYSPVDDKPGKQSLNMRHRVCFDAFFNRIVKLPAAQHVIGRREVHWGKGNPQGRTLGAMVSRFYRHEPYERYRAVNWNNSATAEVRIFHSTDDLDDILACIEMVDAVINFTHPRRGGATQSQITGRKYPDHWLWDTFCEWVVRRESVYPHLAAALVD